MELKYKNWKEISINTFNELKNIDYNKEEGILGELEANIELLSILCDVEDEVISNLSTTEFHNLLMKTEFLKEMPKVKVEDTYIINGTKYKLFLSLKQMSVAQYVDFQTYFKDQQKYFRELLSVFLIPKGMKYGEGYNIDDTINDIGEYLSIVDANSILFFFAILFQSLTKVILNSSIKEMKKLKKKMTNKEEIEKLETVIKELERAKVLAKSGIGYTS
jgi:hypothetical protein